MNERMNEAFENSLPILGNSTRNKTKRKSITDFKKTSSQTFFIFSLNWFVDLQLLYRAHFLTHKMTSGLRVRCHINWFGEKESHMLQKCDSGQCQFGIEMGMN